MSLPQRLASHGESNAGLFVEKANPRSPYSLLFPPNCPQPDPDQDAQADLLYACLYFPTECPKNKEGQDPKKKR